MDFLVLPTVVFDSRLLIHRDRSIGKQAEATAMHGSTLVHIPASTNDPIRIRIVTVSIYVRDETHK